MARIIQGTPISWGSSFANLRFPGDIYTAAWSPCSRFIATAHNESSEIVILDAETLKQLYTMHLPQIYIAWRGITFSPGGHFLTAFSWDDNCIISWDLQTGGLLSNISTEEDFICDSVSYSGCETMIGSLFDRTTLIIYNVLSGTCLFSHSIQQSIVEIIWTHGEHLQFATQEPDSVAIWQVSFTSSHPPTRICSLSTPDNFNSDELVLLPTLSQLAFIFDGEIFVWDAQHQKILLHSGDVGNPRAMSFSPDGHFFVCGTEDREFCIWKKSPTGYLFHQKLMAVDIRTTPLISPNGESIVIADEKLLQLWHTTGSPASTHSMFMQSSEESLWFFVEFSPDESLVAVTKRLSDTVTVIDTNSGNPWLVIDTDTETCDLRMTEDKIIVVGNGTIVTWRLPARDCASNTRRDISNCVQIITFEHSTITEDLHASISPSLKYFAFQNLENYEESLCIYHTHTGERLAFVEADGGLLGFTPNSHIVWCAAGDGEVDTWKIIEENGSNAIQLKELRKYMKPGNGFPWHSPHGYQVTKDGWIVCSSGKYLLWLPCHWQQDEKIQRKWSGKFLAVWNWNSAQPYILKLEV